MKATLLTFPAASATAFFIPPPRRNGTNFPRPNFLGDPMITHTLTSDPAVGLELGRRLALNAKSRKPTKLGPLGLMWQRLFPRQPVKLGTLHS